MRTFRITRVVRIIVSTPVLLTLVTVASPVAAQPPEQPRQDATHLGAARAFAKVPMGFETNDGQAPADVKFLARGPGYSVALLPAEIVLALRKSAPLATQRQGAPTAPVTAARASVDFDLLRVQFVGANAQAAIEPFEKSPHRTAYYFGNDPAKWRRDVATYAKVRYRHLYPGIDLLHSATQEGLKSDWMVAPGANVRTIRMRFPGAQKIQIDRNGRLVLTVGAGVVTMQTPHMYQELPGGRREIRGRYVSRTRQEIGFEATGYDPKYGLVIDPMFAVSSYLGGSGWDQGNGIALNLKAGWLVVTGATFSTDFPSLCLNFGGGGCPQPRADGDGFLLLYPLDGGPGGLTLFFGGSKFDSGNAVAIDASGNTYVAGTTRSADFPVTTKTPYLGDSGKAGTDGDVFVMKFDASFGLVYSTFFGGTHDEAPTAIAADASGRAVVVGYTASPDFETAGKFQAYRPGCNHCPKNRQGFLVVLEPTLDPNKSLPAGLVYATYLGGSVDDQVNAVAVDQSGLVYITGQAASHDFPTTKQAFQPTFQCMLGSSNAFVAKIDPTQNGPASLVWSTYLGGNYYETGHAIAVDGNGFVYVTGTTMSDDFPTKNAILPANPTPGVIVDHVFVSKLTPDGTALAFSTYFGSQSDEDPTAIALDSFGNIYVAGYTNDPDFPVARPIARSCGACQRGGRSVGFVTALNDTGSGLLYSTFVGQGVSQYQIGLYVNAMAVDPTTGDAYLTGSVGGTVLPAVNALQAAFRSKYVGTPDAFVVKLSDGVSLDTQSMAWGNMFVNANSGSQRATLYAPARRGVSIASITSDPEFPMTTTCGNSLVAGGSCTIDVWFRPASAGSKQGALTVTHNGAGSPATIALTGIGGVPELNFSPQNGYNFGLKPLGPTTDATVMLANNGDAPLGSFITVTQSAPDFQALPGCVQTAPHTSCPFHIYFQPFAGGDRSGTLTLAPYDDPSQTVTYALTGQGQAPAVSLTPSRLVFSGAYQLPNAQMITLQNTGYAPLTITKITVSPGSSYSVSDTCPKKPQTLARLATCSITVKFIGTMSKFLSNDRIGSLQVTSDAQGSPHMVPLTGSIGAPALALMLTMNQLAKPVGTSSLVYPAATLLNSGSGMAMVKSISVHGGDFAAEGSGCGTCRSSSRDATSMCASRLRQRGRAPGR